MAKDRKACVAFIVKNEDHDKLQLMFTFDPGTFVITNYLSNTSK